MWSKQTCCISCLDCAEPQSPTYDMGMVTTPSLGGLEDELCPGTWQHAATVLHSPAPTCPCRVSLPPASPRKAKMLVSYQSC